MVDWCTWFPEKWVTKVGFLKFKVIEIWPCCKEHDKTLSSHKFYECLKKKKVLGYSLITIGGSIGAWFKYTRTMFKRI